jgi:hypothetical protein
MLSGELRVFLAKHQFLVISSLFSGESLVEVARNYLWRRKITLREISWQRWD